VPPEPVTGRRTTIRQPGKYCLAKDLWVDGSHQPWRWDGPTFFSDDSVVLEIVSSNVAIDLQGHQVGSDALLTAAVQTAAPRRDSRTGNGPATAAGYSNLSLRNGAIVVKRSYPAVVFDGLEPLENSYSDVVERTRRGERTGESSDVVEALKQHLWMRDIVPLLLPAAADCPVRNLRLENLKIRSGQTAIILQGAGSVIRGSTIETDSGTAIQIHGPNALIENNTIIVHCSGTAQSSSCRTADAPIRLVHGDGAVIRNNRIVMKSDSQKHAVSVFSSGRFTFENNVVVTSVGSAQFASAWTGTLDMAASGNRLDTGRWTRFKSSLGL
jgi:Right handed beta helix region